jgi:hypothetical protein
MEMKLLHLCVHNHPVELQALEHVIQTLLDGPFDHENLLWEIDIWHMDATRPLPCWSCIHPHNLDA